MKWACRGDVRGECGVIHRSWDAAYRHCRADQDGITARMRRAVRMRTGGTKDDIPQPGRYTGDDEGRGAAC